MHDSVNTNRISIHQRLVFTLSYIAAGRLRRPIERPFVLIVAFVVQKTSNLRSSSVSSFTPVRPLTPSSPSSPSSRSPRSVMDALPRDVVRTKRVLSDKYPESPPQHPSSIRHLKYIPGTAATVEPSRHEGVNTAAGSVI